MRTRYFALLFVWLFNATPLHALDESLDEEITRRLVSLWHGTYESANTKRRMTIEVSEDSSKVVVRLNKQLREALSENTYPSFWRPNHLSEYQIRPDAIPEVFDGRFEVRDRYLSIQHSMQPIEYRGKKYMQEISISLSGRSIVVRDGEFFYDPKAACTWPSGQHELCPYGMNGMVSPGRKVSNEVLP